MLRGLRLRALRPAVLVAVMAAAPLLGREGARIHTDPGYFDLTPREVAGGVEVSSAYWGEMIAILVGPDVDDAGVWCAMYIDNSLVWSTEYWCSTEVQLCDPLPDHPWDYFSILHDEAVTAPGYHSARYLVQGIGQLDDPGPLVDQTIYFNVD